MGNFLSEVVFRATHKTIAAGFDRTGCFDVFFYPSSTSFWADFQVSACFSSHTVVVSDCRDLVPKSPFTCQVYTSLKPDYIYKKFRATELGW